MNKLFTIDEEVICLQLQDYLHKVMIGVFIN